MLKKSKSIIKTKENNVKKITEKVNKKDNFRLSCKKLFLTYSQCDIPLKEVLSQLKEKLATFCVTSYIIAQENHKEVIVQNDLGIMEAESIKNEEISAVKKPGVHLHIFLETSKKVNITNPDRLHLVKNDIVFKGNYQSVKNKNHTIEYILKDIPFRDDPNLLYSDDLKDRISEIAAYESFPNALLSLIKQGKIEAALELYQREDPLYYCKNHMSLEKSFRELHFRSLGIPTHFTFDQFIIPEYVQLALTKAIEEKKSLVLVGQPGSGKSKLIESYLTHELKLNPLIINNIDALRFFKEGIHKSIVFDDCSFSGREREELIKLIDSEDGTTFSVKHNSIKIPKNIQRYIITNKDLATLFGQHYLDTAISRRIILVKLKEDEKLYLIQDKESGKEEF